MASKEGDKKRNLTWKSVMVETIVGLPPLAAGRHCGAELSQGHDILYVASIIKEIIASEK